MNEKFHDFIIKFYFLFLDNAFSYVNGGFTGLQILLDKILISLVSGKEVDTEVGFKFIIL